MHCIYQKSSSNLKKNFNLCPQVSLKHIFVSNNLLTSLDNIFRGSFNLEIIDFEYNQLTSLSVELFHFLNLIKEINLGWNKLSMLDGKMSGFGLRNLERVRIFKLKF